MLWRFSIAIAFVDISWLPIPAKRSVSRYAVTASRFASLSFIAGISDPAAPEASVLRLIRLVRSGPNRPLAGVPADCVAVDAGGGFEDALARTDSCSLVGGLCCAVIQAAKSAGLSTESATAFGALCSAILLVLSAISRLLLIRLFQQATIGGVRRDTRECKSKIPPRQKPYRWV